MESNKTQNEGYNEFWAKPLGTAGAVADGEITDRAINTGQIDTIRGRIIVGDTQNDRVLAGSYGDFLGLKVSRPGYDVKSSQYAGELLFSSDDVDDWKNFNPANFTYSSATRISIANYTPSDFFQLGDKLEIVQTTAKYFYIGVVGNNYIDVIGGDDYTVANTAITSFAISRVDNPAGFPDYFDFTPAIYDAAGASITVDTKTCKLNMVGSLAILRYAISDTTFPASKSMIIVSSPFSFMDTDIYSDSQSVLPLSAGGKDIFVDFSMIASYVEGLGFLGTPIGGGNFNSGDFVLNTTIISDIRQS